MECVVQEGAVRQVRASDLERCCAVEAACFCPAEAADPDSVAVRMRTYPQGFLVAEVMVDNAPMVVGMVNSGATSKDDISDEAFKKLVGHDPDGRNLVIFSLAVLPEWQGRGLARQLMEAFARRAAALGKERILLICKEYYIGLYERLGYRNLGPSASSHGGASWYEMVLELDRCSPQGASACRNQK